MASSKQTKIARAQLYDQLQMMLVEAHRIAKGAGYPLLSIGIDVGRQRLSKPDVDYTVLAKKLIKIGPQVTPKSNFAHLLGLVAQTFNYQLDHDMQIDRVSKEDQELMKVYLETAVDLANAYILTIKSG